jgi:hypothetical protein
MKKIKSIFVLATLTFFMLMPTTSFARKPPNNVYNYVENGHLFVWYQNDYIDMGEFVHGQCPTC